MKIRSIEVKNYKCHKKTSIPISSNLHTFIGPNNAGKTSIIESCKLVKSFTQQVEYGDIVYGGITENTPPKIVSVKFIIELAPEERNYFFLKYFFLSSELIEDSTATEILTRITLTFSTQHLSGNKAVIALTEIAVSDTDNKEFIPVLALSDDGKKIAISEFKPGIKGRINNNPYVNDHLKNLKKDLFAITELPPGTFQAEIVQSFITSLRFVPSVRGTTKIVDSKYFEDYSTIDEAGSDLISMMHAMYLNRPNQYNEVVDICKRLFPEIESIHPRQLAKDRYTIAIRKKNIPNEVLLGHEGTGIDQLFIMVWLIATAKPGTIWFIDEPELHLHPGAQKLFYDYIIDKTEGSQILFTSHSMVFIHKSDYSQVTLLLYGEDGIKNVLLADLVAAEKEYSDGGVKKIQRDLYSALGYDPTFAFEPKTVVIIEGFTDKEILTLFCKTLDQPIDQKSVHFQIIGNKCEVKNFSPILIYALSNKKCLIVIDNDKGAPQEIKQSIYNSAANYSKKIHLDKQLLSEDNFFLFPPEVYSIEYYLLEPQAIYDAFNCSDVSILSEVQQSIDRAMDDIKNKRIFPKIFLNELCEKYFQHYDETDDAITIAKHVSSNHLKKHPEIVELVKLITT